MKRMSDGETSFARYLSGQGLDFGLKDGLLEEIGRRTGSGEDCIALLEDESLAAAGVHPEHLLRIRRAWRRYRSRSQGAAQSPGPTGDSPAALAQETLERGRLRMHVKDTRVLESEEFEELAEHSEGCAEIPPHRWFKIARGVSDGLLWVEVILPDDVFTRDSGAGDSAEMRRAAAKLVLDAVGERSERKVIAAAAEALYGLLIRAPVSGRVAGVAIDRKQLHVCLLHEQEQDETVSFGVRDLEGLAGWFAKQQVSLVGLAAVRGASIADALRALLGAGLDVEPVREAGLMKQAGGRQGPIMAAAARVVAERLRDPLEGYAELEPDELGLGEYLDRVDPHRLQAALADARDVAIFERKSKKTAGRAVGGMSANPMVRSLADLRPGMQLSGSVVNLTHFGAFVELGFEKQGLIHLSELSEEHVEHPSEVVRVGDPVRVRVLEVDEARGRISLSLREGRQQRSRPRSRRSQALSDLDKLFRK